MKVAIFGAGSLGTVLGAYIARNNEQIDLINHNKEHIEALKTFGARIIGRVEFNQKVNALTVEEMDDNYDIIYLLTKQLDNENVVKMLKNHLNKDGVICTMQNGLPEKLISSIIGEDNTYGCVIGWGARIIEPGVVKVTSTPETFEFTLGALTEKGRNKIHFQETNRLLSMMGKVIISNNFIGDRFTKILANSSFSGLSAVFGLSFGEICKNKKTRLLAQKIMKEIIEVAKAHNIKLEPIQGNDVGKIFDYHNKFKEKLVYMIIPFAMRKHKLTKASMLRDLQNHKKCEIDAINGIVSIYAREKNVPTPINDLTIKLVHEIEDGVRTSTIDNLKEYFH